MDCQTLVGLPLTDRPWNACFVWQSLVGVPLTGRRWLVQHGLADLWFGHAIVLACQLLSSYSAKLLCLTSSLLTICTIFHYLHYSQLFLRIPNRQTLAGMPFSGRFWLVCRWLADLGWYAMLLAGRPSLACHWLSDLRWHAMHGQTLVGMPVFQQTLAVRPMIGIAWLPCYFLAELGWSGIDWQSLVCYAIFC